MDPFAFAGRARLVALHADVRPQECLLETDLCTIGRSPECNVVVGRPMVSRLHAQIERHGSHYVLYSLGRHPTYVNDTLVDSPHVLRDREKIGLAVSEPLLIFQDSDPTADVPARRLHYDEKKMSFTLDGHAVSLAPQELRLLLHLYRHSGRVCPYDECARAVWGDEYLPELEVDNLNKVVFRLRKKLKLPPDSHLIVARRGVGYMLKD